MWLSEVWASGIDWKLPGNGGPECAAYLSPQRKVLEFITGVTLSLISLLVGTMLHQRPSPIQNATHKSFKHSTKVTNCLLVAMALTYLMEIGYKFYSHQAIFVFNPCHCLCLVQMFILHRLKHPRNEPDLTLIYTFRYKYSKHQLLNEILIDFICAGFTSFSFMAL